MLRKKIPSSGPIDAEVFIVGEAPGVQEEMANEPFVGSSGQELSRMLHEAGILRTECRIANVCRFRPPQNEIKNFFVKFTAATRIPGLEIAEGILELKKEIETVKPKLIIALGETALWALTGKTGITKWRGSQLTYETETFKCILIPTYHPAAILRQWTWRFAGVIDLKRAARELATPSTRPQYCFSIRPSFETAIKNLESVPSGMATLDIETRGGHITCVGIGISRLEAFSIPFACTERPEGYWTIEEELIIIEKFRQLFKRDDIKWVLQNGLYDLQYFARYWGCMPKVYMDTMIAHHVCFSGLQKSLDFLSSIYCTYHTQWKLRHISNKQDD